ncbi:hypothetical protein Btru_004798 [Bulinus truncatus]|nr:hypothetical protein Btru_004798 [Bulinus truncatus]
MLQKAISSHRNSAMGHNLRFRDRARLMLWSAVVCFSVCASIYVVVHGQQPGLTATSLVLYLSSLLVHRLASCFKTSLCCLFSTHVIALLGLVASVALAMVVAYYCRALTASFFISIVYAFCILSVLLYYVRGGFTDFKKLSEVQVDEATQTTTQDINNILQTLPHTFIPSRSPREVPMPTAPREVTAQIQRPANIRHPTSFMIQQRSTSTSGAEPSYQSATTYNAAQNVSSPTTLGEVIPNIRLPTNPVIQPSYTAPPRAAHGSLNARSHMAQPTASGAVTPYTRHPTNSIIPSTSTSSPGAAPCFQVATFHIAQTVSPSTASGAVTPNMRSSTISRRHNTTIPSINNSPRYPVSHQSANDTVSAASQITHSVHSPSDAMFVIFGRQDPAPTIQSNPTNVTVTRPSLTRGALMPTAPYPEEESFERWGGVGCSQAEPDLISGYLPEPPPYSQLNFSDPPSYSEFPTPLTATGPCQDCTIPSYSRGLTIAFDRSYESVYI